MKKGYASEYEAWRIFREAMRQDQMDKNRFIPNGCRDRFGRVKFYRPQRIRLRLEKLRRNEWPPRYQTRMARSQHYIPF